MQQKFGHEMLWRFGGCTAAVLLYAEMTKQRHYFVHACQDTRAHTD